MDCSSRVYFGRVAIMGVGLIGASIALSMRKRGLCGSVTGFGRKEENLVRAKGLGIIDDYKMDAAAAAADADLVVLATPVGILGRVASDIRGSLKEGATVTDVGSVKGALVSELESLTPDGCHFIGSHPIAGSDKSGIDDARESLFDGARCIVTPISDSDKDALEKVCSLWANLGGIVECMDPFRHDEIFALVSHMPHLVAYALVNTVGSMDASSIEYSGGGFRDTTRIAASSPELWRDISMANRSNLLKTLRGFMENLSRIEKCLDEHDPAGIEDEFGKAQRLRSKIG